MSIKYSKGICWIGDCRIPFVDEGDKSNATPQGKVIRKNFKPGEGIKGVETNRPDNSLGRFTPNLLVCDDMLNDGSISQNNKQNKEWELQYDNNAVHDYIKKVGVSRFNDKGTNSRYYDLDLWFEKLINEA